MIASVRKITRILNCFTKEEPALGISEIAEKLDMHTSTVHHLVKTLCEEGVLIKDQRKKIPVGMEASRVEQQCDVSAGYLQ